MNRGTPNAAYGVIKAGHFSTTHPRYSGVYLVCRISRSAFTLVEILVVLAVIAVAAGIMVPRMGASLSGREVREAAGRFATTARTVRELAVARAQVFTINIDIEQGYVVTLPGGAGKEPQTLRYSWLKPERWPESVRRAVVETADGQVLTRGEHRLVFNPDGSSSGMGLRLQGAEEDNAYAVVVYPQTGRVVLTDVQHPAQSSEQVDLGD